MGKNEKVAVFDFCETLVPFQSADKFIEFVSQEHNSLSVRFWKTFQKVLWKFKVVRVLNHFFPNGSVNKRLLLKQLRGLGYEYLEIKAEQFYNTIIKPSLIPEIISVLRQKQNDGFRIIIDSGGFDIYLKYFIQDYNIQESDLLCTRLAFRKGVSNGSFINPDCMGENKIQLLDSIIKKSDCFVEVYSDSISDLPLLSYADKAFVIIEKGKYNWLDNNNYKFNILLWQR